MPGGCQEKIAEKVGKKISEKAVESVIKQQSGGKIKKLDMGDVKIPSESKDLVPPGFKAGVYSETKDGIGMIGSVNMSPEEVENFYVKKFGKPAGKLRLGEGTITLSWDDIGLGVVIKGSGKVSEIWLTKKIKVKGNR